MDSRVTGMRNSAAPASPAVANQPVHNRDKTHDNSQWHQFTQRVVNGKLMLEWSLTPEEVPSLADWLATSPPELRSLTLNGHHIGDAGAAALAEALKINTALTTLNLYNNDIGDDGAASLADALKINTALTTLNLEFNDIGKDGAASLADALKTNTILTTLYLWDNGVDSNNESLKEIKEKLQRNQQLPEQVKGAAVALDLANNFQDHAESQLPAELIPLIVQQLVALPPNQMAEGFSTIQQLSKSVGHPPIEPDSSMDS